MPQQRLKLLANVPAGTNITGLVPYSLPDFLTEAVSVIVGL